MLLWNVLMLTAPCSHMSMAWMCHEGGTGKLYGKNSRVVGTMQPATGSTEEEICSHMNHTAR
jgi:hypothetical protein